MRLAPTRFQLDDGYSFCSVINGCWQLASGHSGRSLDREALLAELAELARAGFDTFDCADIYTGVEELLGELRRRLLPEGIEIAIHTKFVPDRSELAGLTRRSVERIVHRSLRRLGVERLDLVQLHWWDWQVPGWIDAASWLDDLRRTGDIARLGVTNTDTVHLAEMLDAGVPILTDQVQYSLLDRRPEHGLADFCREQGVELLCYGTLAGGFLTGRYLDTAAPTPPFDNRSLEKYRLMIDESGGWPRFQGLLERLAEVAARHGVEVANVAARWVLDRPGVGGIILGATGAHHLEENLQLFELEIDAADHRRLADFLAEHPGAPGDVYSGERQWDGPHAAILRTDLSRAD